MEPEGISNIEDAALLKAYRRGEREALGKLMVKHQRTLYSFIINMTEGREDADDIFQETWFRALRKLTGYRHAYFRAWLLRISRNLIIDRARARRKTVSLDEPSGGEQPLELGDRLRAAGADPAALATDAELGRRLQAAVKTLPAEQREVFLLRMQAEVSFREIARIQGVSINTALARMHYALGKLRGALRTDYEALRR
jgi:RNA polymerase sigma-70 factor (ECF subfamily)